MHGRNLAIPQRRTILYSRPGPHAMLEHAASEGAELGARQAREARGWYIRMTTDIFW